MAKSPTAKSPRAMIPLAVWTELSLDVFGTLPTQDYLLVLPDDLSRYPIVLHTLNTTSNEIIL